MYIDLNKQNIYSDLIDGYAIKESIKNIIFTKKGSICGFPEFGVDLESYLFEQMSAITIINLQNIINNQISIYETRINNISVIVKPVPEFNQIIIDISFNIIENNVSDNLTIKI